MTELGKWLRAKMQERGMSLNAAALYSKVAASTLSEIINHGHVPKKETLMKLARRFETDPHTVFELAGVFPPASEMDELHPRVRELVRRIRGLDVSLQAVIVRAWESNLEMALEVREQTEDAGDPGPGRQPEP